MSAPQKIKARMMNGMADPISVQGSETNWMMVKG
jgi:hypothetical protein